MNPIYTPGAQDINNESVVLTLTSVAIDPCTNIGSSEFTLTINPAPLAPVSGTDLVCANSYGIEYSAIIPDGYSYNWSVENGSIDTSWQGGCLVNWNDSPSDFGNVQLFTTDDATNCTKLNEFAVGFSDKSALDPTTIVAKPKTGRPVVLICVDSGNVYQWYKNYQLIQGATRQFFYPPDDDPGANDIESGVTYQVLVQNYSEAEFKCATMSEEYVYFLNKSLLFEQSDIFIIYPNPAQTYFTVSLNEEIVPENFESCIVKIYDIAGKIVYEEEIFEMQKELKLIDIDRGLYFVEAIMSENTRQIRKLIVN
ncbi:MAG: T9SS type A sorting domain-containing protein [Bacteroidales bacterium]